MELATADLRKNNQKKPFKRFIGISNELNENCYHTALDKEQHLCFNMNIFHKVAYTPQSDAV